MLGVREICGRKELPITERPCETLTAVRSASIDFFHDERSRQCCLHTEACYENSGRTNCYLRGYFAQGIRDFLEWAGGRICDKGRDK